MKERIYRAVLTLAFTLSLLGLHAGMASAESLRFTGSPHFLPAPLMVMVSGRGGDCGRDLRSAFDRHQKRKFHSALWLLCAVKRRGGGSGRLSPLGSAGALRLCGGLWYRRFLGGAGLPA